MHEWGNLRRCGVEFEANDLKNALILLELDWPDQDQMRGVRKQPPRHLENGRGGVWTPQSSVYTSLRRCWPALFMTVRREIPGDFRLDFRLMEPICISETSTKMPERRLMCHKTPRRTRTELRLAAHGRVSLFQSYDELQ